MEHYELGPALAEEHIAELRRQADRWRLASRIPAGPQGATGTARQHRHGSPAVFDAGHCRACARQAGLLDHYRRVQQQEATLRQAHGWARAARRRASVALWSCAAAIRLAVIALLSG